jgi:hypothetical protein
MPRRATVTLNKMTPTIGRMIWPVPGIILLSFAQFERELFPGCNKRKFA